MIIHALNQLATRLTEEGKLAAPGFVPQNISYCVILNQKGKLLQIQDLREGDKKPVLKSLSVPKGFKRSSGVASQCCWDNAQYIFGIDLENKSDRIQKCFESFVARHQELSRFGSSPTLEALLKFLDSWQPLQSLENLPEFFPDEKELATANFVFRLDGEKQYLHESPAIQQGWSLLLDALETGQGVCLITGEKAPIARLHPPIKGIPGGQSAGVSLVSFNLNAFNSYGKEQSFNSPVSTLVTESYGKSLNYLLRYESEQKVNIGHVTHVFWSEKANVLEKSLLGFMAVKKKEGARDSLNEEIKQVMKALEIGRFPNAVETSQGFYILGLSPNAARVSVRYWLSSTLGEVFESVKQHFEDLKIQSNFTDRPEFPSLSSLLLETATLGKFENINPNLDAGLTKAFLSGSPYPATLLAAVLQRIRADGKINSNRAALIKGFLIRKARILNLTTEATVSLNKESSDPGYLLGRLFAILEKAQTDAHGGKVNATIKDRFYGSASATPKMVFPLLLRGAQNHLKKAEWGHNLERLIQEVVDKLTSFPSHLHLEQQGLFALGYYHQITDLFTKKNKGE